MYLFLPGTQALHNLFKPITRVHVLDLLQDVSVRSNLDSVSGHSFRIGGALRLLLDGVEPEIIMKLGGWSSLCFLVYWRRLEVVIPTHIAQAWDIHIRDFAACHKVSEDADVVD